MPTDLSDEEFQDEDDIELDDNDGLYGEKPRTRAKGKGKGKELSVSSAKDKGKGKATEGGYSWEASLARSWDVVQEDEAGSLQGAVQDLLARGRRRRLLTSTGAIRRTIIRHLILILDLSSSMMDRDMRPNRFDLTLQYSREFITEWFDQNPLGQIGIVGMRAGVGERIGDMSGNPQEVLRSISERTRLEPDGEPSLQNAVEIARGSMSHLPTHSSREIVILFGSLTTCDPGNIHETLNACVKDKIRISVVALAAEMKICREMCDKTGGIFGVVLNEDHYKDLLFELIPPPAQSASRLSLNASSDLMQMGFPTRLPSTSLPALCVCHSTLKSEGFLCPRCGAKVCDVPTDCDICGLMIVSSPHLARSYHHLFPVKAFIVVMQIADDVSLSPTCTGCSIAFPEQRQALTASAVANETLSPYGRYRCPDCNKDFCAECDEFIHTVLHVCPGCTS